MNVYIWKINFVLICHAIKSFVRYRSSRIIVVSLMDIILYNKMKVSSPVSFYPLPRFDDSIRAGENRKHTNESFDVLVESVTEQRGKTNAARIGVAR